MERRRGPGAHRMRIPRSRIHGTTIHRDSMYVHRTGSFRPGTARLRLPMDALSHRPSTTRQALYITKNRCASVGCRPFRQLRRNLIERPEQPRDSASTTGDLAPASPPLPRPLSPAVAGERGEFACAGQVSTVSTARKHPASIPFLSVREAPRSLRGFVLFQPRLQPPGTGGVPGASLHQSINRSLSHSSPCPARTFRLPCASTRWPCIPLPRAP
jgi:hypothetical protein